MARVPSTLENENEYNYGYRRSIQGQTCKAEAGYETPNIIDQPTHNTKPLTKPTKDINQ